MITKNLDKSGINVYTLSNSNGMEVDVISLGAAIVNVRIPSKKGTVDVVLGFDDLNMYKINPAFFGICVGPVANRTAKAQLTIDDVKYSLPVNENDNNLHTDFDNGLHKRTFSSSINFEKNQLLMAKKSFSILNLRIWNMVFLVTESSL